MHRLFRQQQLYLQDQIFYRSEEHTSELQSHSDLVCRLLLEKKKAPIAHASPRRPTSINLVTDRTARLNSCRTEVTAQASAGPGTIRASCAHTRRTVL